MGILSPEMGIIFPKEWILSPKEWILSPKAWILSPLKGILSPILQIQILLYLFIHGSLRLFGFLPLNYSNTINHYNIIK